MFPVLNNTSNESVLSFLFSIAEISAKTECITETRKEHTLPRLGKIIHYQDQERVYTTKIRKEKTLPRPEKCIHYQIKKDDTLPRPGYITKTKKEHKLPRLGKRRHYQDQKRGFNGCSFSQQIQTVLLLKELW